MKKLIFPALFLGICSMTFGQFTGQAANTMSTGVGGSAAGEIAGLLGPINERNKKTKDLYADFQGSPYISNTFLPTTMFYGDENLGTIYYRHNALNEEVEIRKSSSEEETIKSLSRDKDVSILVNGKKMSFKTFVTSKKKTLNGYLTTLMDGKTYKLYKRTHVKFTEGKAATNSFVKAVPSRFAQFTEYYFQKEGVNRMDEISLKNKKLIKLVDSSKKEALKSYLKENNLNIRKEADLIKAVTFLNN